LKLSERLSGFSSEIGLKLKHNGCPLAMNAGEGGAS